jgi:hypothetical protein
MCHGHSRKDWQRLRQEPRTTRALKYGTMRNTATIAMFGPSAASSMSFAALGPHSGARI